MQRENTIALTCKVESTNACVYRMNKSAHDAIGTARERCYKHAWVLDLDNSKFFDTINHELLMKAVSLHVKDAWMVLYIKHWLKVPYKDKDDVIMERNAGVPQGV